MPVDENLTTEELQRREGKHIRAADMPSGWKADLVISDINVDEFTEKGKTGDYKKKKFVLSFAGKEKTHVLNATNQAFLEVILGKQPAKWIGATITMGITSVKGPNGNPVPGFVIVGAKPVNPATAQTAAKDVPF